MQAGHVPCQVPAPPGCIWPAPRCRHLISAPCHTQHATGQHVLGRLTPARLRLLPAPSVGAAAPTVASRPFSRARARVLIEQGCRVRHHSCDYIYQAAMQEGSGAVCTERGLAVRCCCCTRLLYRNRSMVHVPCSAHARAHSTRAGRPLAGRMYVHTGGGAVVRPVKRVAGQRPRHTYVSMGWAMGHRRP